MIVTVAGRSVRNKFSFDEIDDATAGFRDLLLQKGDSGDSCLAKLDVRRVLRHRSIGSERHNCKETASPGSLNAGNSRGPFSGFSYM
jgi:hypothetical protein